MTHSLTPQERKAITKRAVAEERAAKKAAAAEAAQKRTVWQVIRLGLSLGIFSIVLLLVAVIIVIPKILGATPLTILTSSMEPGLPPGTLVVVAPVAPQDVRIGDVITYQIESGKPAVVTHRVTEVVTSTSGETTFTLKGDNNADADPPVLAIQLQGKLVYSLPWVGNLSSILNGPSRETVLPIIAGAMVLYAIVSITLGLISAFKKRRGTPRHAVSQDAPRQKDVSSLDVAQVNVAQDALESERNSDASSSR